MGQLRQFGKDAAALMALLAVLAFVIHLFGGRAVPWVTPAEADAIVKTQQETSATITNTLRKTNETLDKTAATLEKIARKIERYDCKDANEKLRLAADALKRNPTDPVAATLRQVSLDTINTIDGCAQDVR